jgi:hypothetical protein
MVNTLNSLQHTCPGCKAVYSISVDPEEQPLSCTLCNFPIRQVRDSIATIFALEYAERLAQI